ncbi:OPT-domain-containing protein [Russula earlei]|uniref:OPT-domain-containing protein n=1 Tax=Russula earlei TaxID=71964 RepID=A0ACC0UJ97_9AGAM|nr:OPT-domain-containing protein [Russula earlei]
MEDSVNSPTSASLSDVAHLRHRQSAPDVPEDVEDELILHFNDPNWDFQANSSTLSISTDGVEPRRWSKASTHLGASTEVDTESQASSWPIKESKADFSTEAVQIQDSPYPEVRAAVANTDDPTMVVNTFRVWFIGLIFSTIIPAYNTVISLRYDVFPAFGYSFSLNPGPFNIKEHALISIMVNVVIDGTAITDIASAMRILQGQYLLGLTLQLFGFSIAGTLRQFLVWPASMIWPGVLVRCALLNTMHSNYGKKDSKHISRERFLYLACLCSFLWYWVPGYLWTGLSVFNWVCWIAPNNVVINSLFGTVSGLGMGLVTFDWAAISLIGSPLVVPWWAQINMVGGFLVVIWFICPILWAKNVFYSQFMPVSVGASFDNTGAIYNLSAILTDNNFDQTKYEQYSPMYLPITYAVTYGTIFATYSAVIVHTFLWYRHDIVGQFRRSLGDQTDIHAYLMRKYPDVPRWWFIALGVISLVIGIIGIEVCQIGLPIWAYALSVIFAVIFALPFGIVQATTNQIFYLSVMAELVMGYMLPGRPIATMFFKTMGGQVVLQALSYSSDLKFGFYLKVPPRIIFIAQIVASLVALLSSIVAQNWALNSIPDICQPGQKSFFTCPNLDIFNNSAIIWGAIGPGRFFSRGAIYYPLVFFFLLGAVLPIPFYYLARRYPRSFLRYVNIPVALIAANSVPPANGVNIVSWALVGFAFQWFMRRFHFRWWMRYNYLLSSGLEAGVVIGIVIIFFALQLPKGGSISLNWWGNNVWKNTADANLVPLKQLAPGQTFGPSTWS